MNTKPAEARWTLTSVDGAPPSADALKTFQADSAKRRVSGYYRLMKLARYESTARDRIGPEGKPLLVEQTSDMSGSGMGQEGRGHTVITYSDYRAVGH